MNLESLKRRRLPINRCIFGPPDIEEIEKMITIQEHQERIFLENNYLLCDGAVVATQDDDEMLKEKAKNEDDKENNKSINRCLFGVPNLDDTEELLTEAIQEDLRRIKERFGFDLEEIHVWHRERDRMYLRKKKFMKGLRTAKRKRLFGDDFTDVKKKIQYQEK